MPATRSHKHSRATIPPGLHIEKRHAGWYVMHSASGLPAHPFAMCLKRDATEAAQARSALAVDWTQPKKAVWAAVVRVPGGEETIARITTKGRLGGDR